MANIMRCVNETRAIRARYDEKSITVYQAYGDAIADEALADGTLRGPHFSCNRMTWIKPSFLWMMYRSGWATKPNQTRILAISLSRDGFEAALSQSCPSSFHPDMFATQEAWRARLQTAPVRIQWDPERDRHLRPLDQRSIQIGIGPALVGNYVDEWIIGISDVTNFARAASRDSDVTLPAERPYPLNPDLQAVLGILPSGRDCHSRSGMSRHSPKVDPLASS